MTSIDQVADLGASVQYVASASQTVFPYPFPIFDDTDLKVYSDSTLLALSTNYTVSGAGNNTGGNVTLIAGVSAGTILTIYRDISIKRTSDYQQNGPLASAAINDELDRMTLVDQQLEDGIGRSIRVKRTATVPSASLELDPAVYAGKYLTMDATGAIVPAVLSATAITAQILGQIFYPRTPGEIAAGVVPVYYNYASGHVFRYGAVGDDITDDTAAIAAAISVIDYVGSAGRGNVRRAVFFPACAGYATTSTTVIPNNILLKGEGWRNTLIDYQGTGVGFAILNKLNGSSAAYVAIQDLTLYCSHATGAQHGLHITGGSLMSFDRISVGGQAKHLVVLNQTEVSSFNNCYFNSLGAINVSNVWFVNDVSATGVTGVSPALTFTGALALGAVSGSLTGAFAGVTGVYAINFVETAGSAAEMRLVNLTNGSTNATWSVALAAACNAVTTGATANFTNRLTLDKCNLNGPGTSVALIVDDGGVCHTITNCNASGGLITYRGAGVSSLIMTGNEWEAALTTQVRFTSTTGAGDFIGPCDGVVFEGNSMYGNNAVANLVDIVSLVNSKLCANTGGGYTTGFFNLSGVNISNVEISNNGKAITGSGKTIAPFFDPGCLGTAQYRNCIKRQGANTYVTATTFAGTGSQTVQPKSMEFIFPGARLQVCNADGTNGETVVVTAVTSTTFTAFFASNKNAINWTIRGATPAEQEEGTWTPTLVGSGTAGANTYAATTVGTYQRRGNLVTYQYEIDISTVDASMAGGLSVNGLPFVAENQTSQNAMSAVSLFSGFTFAGAYTFLGGFIAPAGQVIQLRKSGSAVALAVLPKTDIAGATCSIYGFGSYTTSAN